ncbi:ubiquitin conjugation factor E4 [Histoplasma capsulatum G186AR]|uniref:Ubiquitin conjugation factor E4 n=1 Tax=Ajellomyces capsulatus TaxID=5037 RepID=A0A8H7Z4Q9_AJECA|nr:ubiquitin conjugation factor E4 [Histoplasma capsulatum]QSS69460.1 ubiquitin conjugation factor E4 [Histoplasma capsulatum G186AR]
MADSIDADKIRNKRLAKLGSQASSTTQSSSQSPSGDNDSEAITSSPVREPTSQRPQINISSNQAPSYPPTSSQSDMRQPNEEAPRIRIGAQPSQSKAKSPDVSGTTTPRVPPRSSETVEDFEDKTLRAVFRVTLDESRRVDVQGQKLSYLVGLVQELQEQGQALRMNIDVLDQALLEAASNTDNGKPMEYLLPCWKRVTRLYKGFRKQNADDRKYVIVSEARRLCMSYCIFAATIPEMFGLGTPPSSTLKPHLLRDPEDDLGLCHDFITEAVKRSNEDETILPAFVGAVEEMSHDLSSLTLNMDYKPYVMALRNLVRFPPLAVAITESELLNTSVNAEQFETATLLGPWFRLSPLQRDVPLNYFSSPKTRDHGFIVNSQRAVRMMQQLLSSDLLDIINQLIRASKSARERVLDWFAASVNLNHKRRALQVDHKTVSSDGFMFNITTCLDQLCEPFMDAAFTKIDRIDIGYLKRNPRVNMRDETKINADQHASDAFYDQVEEGTSNFITEIFFLTVAAHHYGSESLTAKLEQLEKDLRHMETQIDKLELERHKWKSNPIQLRMFEDALKKYKDKFDLGLSFKYTLQGILLDDIWQARSMQVMRYVIVWLLRIASGRNFPTEALKLPLPEKQPENFKCLPEYFVDDVVSSFKFIMWSMPHVVTSTQGDELIMLCITFLQSSEYIKNPYLKAGLVTILYRGTWRRRNGSRGVLVDLLNSLPFATEHLLHALMKFYIEAEFTGTHTQFFDKFNIRYEIFQIIQCIWPNPVYRDKLHNEANWNLDFFVRFVNLLLNDVTFVLDESFTAFLTIHDLQVELRREGSNMEQNVRQQKEEQLAAAQGRAKSYMQLTNETVAMLKLFTEALADSFTMPEIVQRLADMLDYNLDAMVGPKSANLRVDNLAEYGFKPRSLLSEIVDVYLNLMDKENFVVAVARDGRSYKPSNFEKAAEILRKWALKPQEDLSKWEQLQTKFRVAKEADEQAEEDLGDIPDEFLDPLVYTLMEDPVILPSSKVSIDRSTIRSHLLSDPNDPFNRAPLSIEDVIPDTETKAKIEAFKAERKAAKLAAMTASALETMDTTDG